jgi:predicted TIM-barrel fold metal-dependent hydrolase
MGPERVIYGSDWPHMEGLPEPGGILDKIDGLDERTRNLFLHDSTRQLTKRRPA